MQLVPNLQSQVLLPDEAVLKRDRLIGRSALLRVVNNPTTQATAVSVGKAIREQLLEIEEARKAVKAPVLALGKAIDAKAEEFTQPLQAELRRVVGLVNGFQEEQERLRREQERLERERVKAALEAEKPAADAPPPRPAPMIPAPAPKPEGMRSAPVWTYEVTDIHAFQRADLDRPVGAKLGTYQVSPSAMASAIRQGLREFPGVRIFQKQSTTFTGR